MRNLVLLSEIDCLDMLNQRGVYPSEYFTSFEAFKNRLSFFSDAVIVCILAGTCAFSKRHILETCMVLQNRADDDFDNGINEVFILSDTVLPNCKTHYYLYRDVPFSFTRYRGWSKKETNLDIWGSLKYDKCRPEKCIKYYSDYDKCDSTKTLRIINQRFSELDELIHLIKVPEINVQSK